MIVKHDPILGKLVSKDITLDCWQINIDKKSSGDFCVDFKGKAMQVYDTDLAVSGTLTFEFTGIPDSSELDTSTSTTVEIMIPANGDISTFIVPDDVILIDMNTTLVADTAYEVTYHAFTSRIFCALVNGEVKSSIQLAYSYSFGLSKIEEEN